MGYVTAVLLARLRHEFVHLPLVILVGKRVGRRTGPTGEPSGRGIYNIDTTVTTPPRLSGVVVTVQARVGYVNIGCVHIYSLSRGYL